MKFYSILEGNTQDVLRRFLRLINKSIARIGTVEATVDDLEDDVGTLKTTVGSADSGLVKSVADINTDVGTLKTTVGSADSGLVKSVADINTVIGDEETANTILYRIKALEDAAAEEETPGGS